VEEGNPKQKVGSCSWKKSIQKAQQDEDSAAEGNRRDFDGGGGDLTTLLRIERPSTRGKTAELGRRRKIVPTLKVGVLVVILPEMIPKEKKSIRLKTVSKGLGRLQSLLTPRLRGKGRAGVKGRRGVQSKLVWYSKFLWPEWGGGGQLSSSSLG